MAWKWQRGDASRHTDGDRAAALGRVKAKTYVMPIDEDMFFPVRDCQTEQELVGDSELHVVNDVVGHLGLFALNPDYIPQIDRHLSELLKTKV
jgi:homoserine O-acetyltransferase/O-succinyltransferase